MLSKKQKKIASKAGDPNKIDAKDFAVLKAEKAKGRGMGLEDEKLKPGKEYVEKAKGGMTKGQKKAGMSKKKTVMKAEEGKLADTSKFLQRRKALGGARSLFGQFPAVEMKSVKPDLSTPSEFVKRRQALGGTKAILSTVLSKTPVGKVAKGIGALAGVGTVAALSPKLSDDESYKEGIEEGKKEGSSFKERAKKQLGKIHGTMRGVIGKKSGGYVRGGRREIKGLRPAKLF